MRQLYRFATISLWLILFIILFLKYQAITDKRKFCTIHSTNHNHDDYVNCGFADFQIQQDKDHEIALENKYQLTAIILHWQRLSGVQQSIQYYLKTQLFKQIIVWNNNPEIKLTQNQLLPNNQSSNLIRIINSDQNLKDEAKYRACSEAKTLVCFYADDDWDTSHYIKSLIASFRSDPTLLHSITDSYTFYTNLVWSYFDSAIDLHTGFSWIGCGSVFLREHAQRHLQLLEMHLKNDRALMSLSDVFFSIWLNQIPSQLSGTTRSLPITSGINAWPFSVTYRFAEMQYNSSVRAIHILEQSLRFNQSNMNIAFPRQEQRRFPYCVRSPNLDDMFIFYSNVLPIDIQHIPFNISHDYARGTRRNLPLGPKVDYFTSHSTLQAVDDDNKTCWCPDRSVRKGDFFSIDFLRIQTNIAFALIIAHSYPFQTSLDMRVSLNGLRWISYRSMKGIFIKTNNDLDKHQYIMIFNSSQFTFGFKSFRYVMFNTTSASSNRTFKVCEVKLINANTE